MKEAPLKDDWINLVIKDLKSIDMSLNDEEQIKRTPRNDFKALVKKKIRESAFRELQAIKTEHSKVRGIFHENLNVPQSYLVCGKFSNKESSLLFNLRSKSVNDFKDNFHTMFGNALCPHCGTYSDSQSHALNCTILKSHMSQADIEEYSSVKYGDLFGNVNKQLKITQMFQTLIHIRRKLAPTRATIRDQVASGLS